MTSLFSMDPLPTALSRNSTDQLLEELANDEHSLHTFSSTISELLEEESWPLDSNIMAPSDQLTIPVLPADSKHPYLLSTSSSSTSAPHYPRLPTSTPTSTSTTPPPNSAMTGGSTTTTTPPSVSQTRLTSVMPTQRQTSHAALASRPDTSNFQRHQSPSTAVYPTHPPPYNYFISPMPPPIVAYPFPSKTSKIPQETNFSPTEYQQHKMTPMHTNMTKEGSLFIEFQPENPVVKGVRVKSRSTSSPSAVLNRRKKGSGRNLVLNPEGSPPTPSLASNTPTEFPISPMLSTNDIPTIIFPAPSMNYKPPEELSISPRSHYNFQFGNVNNNSIASNSTPPSVSPPRVRVRARTHNSVVRSEGKNQPTDSSAEVAEFRNNVLKLDENTRQSLMENFYRLSRAANQANSNADIGNITKEVNIKQTGNSAQLTFFKPSPSAKTEHASNSNVSISSTWNSKESKSRLSPQKEAQLANGDIPFNIVPKMEQVSITDRGRERSESMDQSLEQDVRKETSLAKALLKKRQRRTSKNTQTLATEEAQANNASNTDNTVGSSNNSGEKPSTESHIDDPEEWDIDELSDTLEFDLPELDVNIP